MRDEEYGKPQWFKLWAEKYYDDLCIEDIHEFYPSVEEENEFLLDVGKAFVSALAYYNACTTEEESFSIYQMGLDGRKLYKSLKRDINQSYESYKRRVENGKKGGRPPKSSGDDI